MEEFVSFDGGLNTMTAEDALSDRELPMLVNKDLTLKGSTKRRYGMTKLFDTLTGDGQGYFRYYKSDGSYDSLRASGGAIYVNGVSKVTGLQTTRSMEAVQYGSKLYIATGSGLYQWDGATLAQVIAYKPQPLEALYVGTNGLAADPNNYMQDGTSASIVSILGVTFSSRYGVVNTANTITAYVNKPAGATVEYKFEIKLTAESSDKWVTVQDWNISKTCNVYEDASGEYEMRISARRQGQTVVDSFYSVPKYVVKPAVDPNDTPIPTSSIGQCNRILLHWDRILLYGDPTQPDVMYISHLKNPAYVPVPNSLQFTNPKLEGLTALVRFRDILVAFTKTSIQALFGKSPSDYQRVTLNTAVGCIAPHSAKVFGNYIGFLSYEGIMILKSVGTVEDKANVQNISVKILSEVVSDTEAVAEVYENQYHLVFPGTQKRLRFYYEQGIWAKDTSPKFNFRRMYTYDGQLYATSKSDSKVYVFDPSVYTDDGYVYEESIETKAFNFMQRFNRKKLKKCQLLSGVVTVPTNVTVEFYIDNALILSQPLTLQPTTGIPSTINGITGDIHDIKIAGKGRTVKVVIRHNEANMFHMLGLNFIFKLKKA
jgi:hypothetical protein